MMLIAYFKSKNGVKTKKTKQFSRFTSNNAANNDSPNSAHCYCFRHLSRSPCGILLFCVSRCSSACLGIESVVFEIRWMFKQLYVVFLVLANPTPTTGSVLCYSSSSVHRTRHFVGGSSSAASDDTAVAPAFGVKVVVHPPGYSTLVVCSIR